jgi:hypothetical protein
MGARQLPPGGRPEDDTEEFGFATMARPKLHAGPSHAYESGEECYFPYTYNMSSESASICFTVSSLRDRPSSWRRWMGSASAPAFR